MSWDAVGPESGIFAFPSANDMVLVACAEGDDDQCFVIKRITSKEDKIPLAAMDGSTVVKSLNGKNVWITSDTQVNISRGDDVPSENVVLGQVWKQLMIDLLEYLIDLCQQLSEEVHIGNLGYLTAPPTKCSQLLNDQSYVRIIKKQSCRG